MADVDMPFSDLPEEDLTFAGMGTVAARHGCYGFYANPFFARFAARAIAVALDTMAEDSPRISVVGSGADLDLSWPGTIKSADGAIVHPYFELQRSLDLRRWEPVGERQRARATQLDQQVALRAAGTAAVGDDALCARVQARHFPQQFAGELALRGVHIHLVVDSNDLRAS